MSVKNPLTRNDVRNIWNDVFQTTRYLTVFIEWQIDYFFNSCGYKCTSDNDEENKEGFNLELLILAHKITIFNHQIVEFLQNEHPQYQQRFIREIAPKQIELRNEYYKGGTAPKVPTIIKGSTNSTMLFEGFMDMLAYLTLIETTTPENSVCVLNSVSNLSKAVEFLRSQQTIHCFLDNDPAGSKALFDIRKLRVEVINQSRLYKDFKDVNDFLMSMKSSHKVEQPIQLKRGLQM